MKIEGYVLIRCDVCKKERFVLKEDIPITWWVLVREYNPAFVETTKDGLEIKFITPVSNKIDCCSIECLESFVATEKAKLEFYTQGVLGSNIKTAMPDEEFNKNPLVTTAESVLSALEDITNTGGVESKMYITKDECPSSVDFNKQ